MTYNIIYTITDEAPALATFSLLPIVKFFTKKVNVNVETKNISLASRILVNLQDFTLNGSKINDDLAYLGSLAKKKEANIIKLPNISASLPQLKSAIQELQSKGYQIPNYPDVVKNNEDLKIKNSYVKVLGSAVNPVLREGNSDRRVAKAVKEYAKKNPHSMGKWEKTSKSSVSHMDSGDFYGNEKSTVIKKDMNVKIVLDSNSGERIVLKDSFPLLKNEIIDSSYMNVEKLNKFFEEQINDAKKEGVLFSIHLKATMMKVSDPIMFGHCVQVFYKNVFNKHKSLFDKIGVNPKNGISDVYAKIANLDENIKQEVEQDLLKVYENNTDIAMVNSDKGITNLHFPNDVIIDASMPAAIRSSGKMWNKDGKLQDTKFIIPDRSYAGIYKATIDFHKENGAFDVSTMGSCSNVGLMAKKAEEYGSHDKTFEIEHNGIVNVIDEDGNILLSNEVSKGDIWRMCQTKDISIKNWVKLAVERAKITNTKAIFWLDENRAHDNNLITKVKMYLKDYDTTNLDIIILSPVEAIKLTLAEVKKGVDVISVTGNVLRDYLTDLFPILELGTSAKMLSIVPLLNGGGLFETGAGGSAPKHVQQVIKENHLRWDSLGEFLALAVSLEDIANKYNDKKVRILAEALNKANTKFLAENKSPSRKVKELDNRGSHFYLALYWAEFLKNQNDCQELQEYFLSVFNDLKLNEQTIVDELNNVQGSLVDLGGYFFPDCKKTAKIMRPSETLNKIIN